MSETRQRKKALGRGLSALFGEAETREVPTAPPGAVLAVSEALRDETLKSLRLADLEPNPAQPRRLFREEELEELAASIRERGVLQPILVRPNPRRDGAPYEIIAGERRWRAAQRAGLKDAPVLVRRFDDAAAFEIALVENVQRADLNPLEEAMGYARLIEDFGYTQERLAQGLGKSRSHIANLLRLLKLPDEARRMLEEGAITAGHARALLASADPLALARRILAEGLSVRQAEKLAQESHQPSAVPEAKTPAKPSAELAARLKALTKLLRAPVEVEAKGKGGRLVIRYASPEELEALCARLGAGT
ncbi:ParB/RepB/Spo0J family partition protein [Neomegalonema sp.]|uniref:ParB/RepB/Spo0J family partition protein n=1 Tax=Neomegalonema sp. TaxID=2039713 RepID=UPI002623F1FC|nr:ParB/RepB/Spo0J family partition protein [Neomegalonema sp.]MDD2867114.1 ParB/RepB/Spo0J family partition protein [Neomegalonema sp.]